MRRTMNLCKIVVLPCLLAGGQAMAANGNSQGQAPPETAEQAGKKPKKAEVGPKDGFPDTKGIEIARRVASQNAAFNRPDSPGG